MLKINEQMHQIWKNQVEEKSLHSSLSNWVMNLPFDSRVKEWVAAEERYKQEVQMKNILPSVADKFIIDWQADQKGGSILCFDEIQVRLMCAERVFFWYYESSIIMSITCKYSLYQGHMYNLPCNLFTY